MTAAVEALTGTLKRIEEALRARTPDNADEVLDRIAESLRMSSGVSPGRSWGRVTTADRVRPVTVANDGGRKGWGVFDEEGDPIFVFDTEAEAKVAADFDAMVHEWAQRYDNKAQEAKQLRGSLAEADKEIERILRAMSRWPGDLREEIEGAIEDGLPLDPAESSQMLAEWVRNLCQHTRRFTNQDGSLYLGWGS